MDNLKIKLMADLKHELLSSGWRGRLVRLTHCIQGEGPSLELCPGDQMLTHSLMHHQDAGVALSQYFAVSLQQFSIARQVIEKFEINHRQPVEVLDFACGYGRLLRLLGCIIPSTQTWAADIQSEAVQFVSQNFGVNPLVSDANPAAFEPSRSFDLIWVASLFSHLPESLFRTWLHRLMSFVKPDGVLCFSVRDTSLLPSGILVPESGFLYFGESENEDLPSSIYGTAYANEEFVRRVVADLLPGASCVRLPRALANEQDLYVVAPNGGCDLSVLAGIRRGPWGWVDVRGLTAADGLDLQGWAGSLDDGTVDRVEVRVDGQPFTASYGIARPDVVEAFGDSRMLMSGWSLRLPGLTCGSPTLLEVEAVSRNDERAVLYAGMVRKD